MVFCRWGIASCLYYLFKSFFGNCLVVVAPYTSSMHNGIDDGVVFLYHGLGDIVHLFYR